MSDQHGADYCQWGRVPVDTPNLQRLRDEGTSFSQAYTSCPLCVPARMSFMSSLLPSHTGVFGNADTIGNTTPCFTHPLVEAGYETVLVGRMHFVGQDQRHGFTKRLAPDMTPTCWIPPRQKMNEERGLLCGAGIDSGCCKVVGGGESNVIHYDRMVVAKALEYLSRPHEKPQFILVGTYGPHFPYVTDPQLYLKYLARVQKPNFFDVGTLPAWMEGLDILKRRVKGPDEVDWEVAKGCLAAYCGQIETMDRQIGQTREAFQAYARRSGRPAVFGYLSDHGDTAGECRIYGKRTYLDKSAKIPLLLAGSGIPQGKTVPMPVSIMDVGPTVCALAGTSFADVADGRSLTPALSGPGEGLEELPVLSQFVDSLPDGCLASGMVRYKRYKYVLYHHYEERALLFDMEADPAETTNLAGEKPQVAAKLRAILEQTASFQDMERQYSAHARNTRWFKAYEAATGSVDDERWKDNPPMARGPLAIAAAQLPQMPERARTPPQYL